MKNKSFTFKFNARLANLFGTELVSSPSVALGELVKNSYDADAREIILTFENVKTPGGTVTIEDNGEGMNAEDLEHKWMVIGTQDKQHNPVSKRFKRRKVGEKGIGRFAVQRLAHTVKIKSKRKGESVWNCLTINWDDYDESKGLFNDILNEFTSEPGPKTKSGVSITLENVRESWDEPSFDQLRKDLYLLFSPFHEEDSNFKVLTIAEEYPSFEGEIESALLTAAVVQGKARLDTGGHLTVQLITKDKKILPIIEKEIGSYECGPFSFEFHTFLLNREGIKGSKLRVNQVRDMMGEYGGVRIYRNNVRVKPYGDRGNDWMDLNLRRSRDPEFRVSTNQIIGTIDIGRDENPKLVDQTNREGLIHNRAFEDLRAITIDCVSSVEAYYWELGRERRKKAQKPESVIQRIEHTVREHKEIPRQVKSNLLKSIADAKNAVKQTEEKHISETQLYRNMATLGISVAIFGHETESVIYCMKNDCKTAITLLQKKYPESENIVKFVSQIEKSADDLQSYSNLITEYLRKRKRERLEVNVCDIVNDILRHYHYLLEHYQIEAKIEFISESVLLDIYRMDLEAVLINFITNAVEALRQVGKRRIWIRVQLLPSQMIEIIFADSGKGVKKRDRERIWNPFFTTKSNGLGLGLAIIKDITEFYDGNVELVDDTEWSGACFRVELPAVSVAEGEVE